MGRTTLADLVLERLITAIGDGDLAQGAQLRDAVLADALSVSRMPVRQALQRLEQIGLVESAPSRFTRVATVTHELAEETIAFAGYAGGVLLRAGMPHADADDLDALAGAAERLGASSDQVEVSDALRDLLRQLIDSGPSHFLGRMLDKSLPAVWCNARRHPSGVEQIIDRVAATALAASIRDSDSALAEASMRRLCRLPV